MYVRVFNPAQAPYAGEEYTCDERTDLVLLGGTEGIPIPPDSYAYVRQFDAIVSASVLCFPSMEGTKRPVAEYTNYPGDVAAQARNQNGAPLQTYGVKAYCRYEVADEYVSDEAPSQVILLCLDHRALPR